MLVGVGVSVNAVFVEGVGAVFVEFNMFLCICMDKLDLCDWSLSFICPS